MMKRRAKPIVAGAVIALSLAGCGGMGSSEQASKSPGTTASKSAAAAPSPRDTRMPLYGQMVAKDQGTPPHQQYPRTAQVAATQQQGVAQPRLSQRPVAQEQYYPTGRRGASAAPSGMSADTVRTVQQQLDQRGYEVGPIDGIWGPRTQQAVTAFQRDENLRASGQIDNQTLAALGVGESGQQVGETPAEPRLESEQPGQMDTVTPEEVTPREQTGQGPAGETGGVDVPPQEQGTLPDTGSEAPGSEQESERSGGIQGNEPAAEPPQGGTPGTSR